MCKIMEMFLQCWGGIGYLLAKILIVRAEYLENDRNLRLIGWIAYLLGLPAGKIGLHRQLRQREFLP